MTTNDRPCTCHPDDNPPRPCPKLYALHECREAAKSGAQQPAAPSAPHPAITHCDNCGCDWLDNGLNPVGCPYCKQSEQAAEAEALRKDAARYRWLRKGSNDDIAVVMGLGAMDYGASGVAYTYSEEIDGDDLDAAIDAAMQRTTGWEGER